MADSTQLNAFKRDAERDFRKPGENPGETTADSIHQEEQLRAFNRWKWKDSPKKDNNVKTFNRDLERGPRETVEIVPSSQPQSYKRR